MALISDVALMNGAVLAAVMAVAYYVYKHPDTFTCILGFIGVQPRARLNGTQREVPTEESDDNGVLTWDDVSVDDGLSFAYRNVDRIPDHLLAAQVSVGLGMVSALDGVRTIDFTECGIW
jgi:hypothetical protein